MDQRNALSDGKRTQRLSDGSLDTPSDIEVRNYATDGQSQDAQRTATTKEVKILWRRL